MEKSSRECVLSTTTAEMSSMIVSFNQKSPSSIISLGTVHAKPNQLSNSYLSQMVRYHCRSSSRCNNLVGRRPKRPPQTPLSSIQTILHTIPHSHPSRPFSRIRFKSTQTVPSVVYRHCVDISPSSWKTFEAWIGLVDQEMVWKGDSDPR